MPDESLTLTLAAVFIAAMVLGLVLWLIAHRFLGDRFKGELPQEKLSLPKPSTIEVDGHCVFYLKQGRGPVVLFLHGIGASSFTWRYQLSSLYKEFTVIAIDLPGFGKSSKDLSFKYNLDNMSRFLLKFMTQLKVQEFMIVGSSMGGTIGLNMCRLSPDRIIKLALIAPATQPQLVPKGVDRLSWLSPWASGLVNEKTMAGIMSRVNANPRMVNNSTIQTVLEPFKVDKNSIATFLKATRIIRDKRLPQLFEKLPTESLILYGSKDKMVPLWAMQRLQKLLHSEIVTHPEAGHHPHEDEYQWVNENLKSFLTSQY